jgi:hypothetical protein
MLTITNRQDLFSRLRKLQSEQDPVFGSMTPQHMVEHLIWTLTISNGKILIACTSKPEEREDLKKAFLFADEYPMGIKSSVLNKNNLPSLKYENLRDSILVLMNELKDFDVFFLENKDATPVHTTMGELSYEEWIMFHNIHFAHHFKQFGI